MVEENISQEFRLKNTDETRNYFIEEIEQNELMCKKHKKFWHFLILVSTITRCILIFGFTSFFAIPIEITSSAIGLKICAITAEIKKYKSIINKKKKKHDKIVLLAKSKLSSIEVSISKALNNWITSHDEFVLINNALKEYDDMKGEIENLNT